MDITPYIDSLRRDLVAAAEAAGPETRQAAERLAFALDPSARLALMEAISQAAAEITAEMPSGAVDVRLNGRELDFVVQGAAPAPPTPPSPPSPTGTEELEEDGSVARITLRMPESVKVKAEELAARSGHSLNTWLVNMSGPLLATAPSTSTSTCRASRSSATTTPSGASAATAA